MFFKEKMLGFNHFWIMSRKFLNFPGNFSNSVVKTALYFSKGRLWGKMVYIWKNYNFLISFAHLAKFFWPSGKVFLLGCAKTAFSVSRVTLWGKISYFEKNFISYFIIFGHWARNSWIFMDFFWTRSAKLLSTYTEEHFYERKFCFWKIYKFFVSVWDA